MIVNETNQTKNQDTTATKQNTQVSESSFDQELKRSEEQRELEEQKKRIEMLYADLISVIRTGLTVSELALLQELLAKIEKFKNDIEDTKSKGKPTAEMEAELAKMISSLESAIAALLKKVNGEAIIESDDNLEGDTKQNAKSPVDPFDFDTRINNIKSSIDNIKQINSNLEDKSENSSAKTSKELEKLQIDKSNITTENLLETF
ncbi:MAG: hypothetical protein U9R37_00530, partial [Campylobacterota bacterium]|nr:hypothetical protein [Campylobacterota bacterium]